MAIVSGYPSRLYADLYAGWTCVTTSTRTDRGVSVTESLWISPNAAQVTQASLFPSASTSMTDHPAPYTDALLPIMADLLPPGQP